MAYYLFQLLLGAQLGGVTARLLAAVDSTRVQACVALAANLLLAVVLAGKHSKRRLDDASAQTKHQVKGGLLLNVVVRKSATILKLLASEDQTLLVRGDPFLVLDLGLDIVDSVGRLHLKGDSLSRKGLNENLHVYSSFSLHYTEA